MKLVHTVTIYYNITCLIDKSPQCCPAVHSVRCELNYKPYQHHTILYFMYFTKKIVPTCCSAIAIFRELIPMLLTRTTITMHIKCARVS